MSDDDDMWAAEWERAEAAEWKRAEAVRQEAARRVREAAEMSTALAERDADAWALAVAIVRAAWARADVRADRVADLNAAEEAELADRLFTVDELLDAARRRRSTPISATCDGEWMARMERIVADRKAFVLREGGDLSLRLEDLYRFVTSTDPKRYGSGP